MGILKNLFNVNNLETFCDKVLQTYYMDLLDNSVLTLHNHHFNDKLIWIKILNNSDVRQALTSVFANSEQKKDSDEGNDKLENRWHIIDVPTKLLLAAISLLQLYVIDNFLFHINRNENKTYDHCLLFVEDFFNLEDKDLNINSIEYSLDIDGEIICPLARNSQLLKLSRLIFEFIMEKRKLNVFTTNPIEHFHFLLWFMRSAIIHQLSLSSSTGTIYNEILNYVKQIELILDSKDLKIDNSLKMNTLVEIVNILVWFGDHENSKKYFSLTQKYSNISVDLIGRLGVRTQFQTKPVSQLTVDVKRLSGDDNNNESPDENNSEEETIPMPKNEKSDDNTLLEEVKFIQSDQQDESKSRIVKLKSIEQAFMITSMKFHQRFGCSNDQLLKEELLTHIYFLIQHCDNWIMQFHLLEIRSLHECTVRRRMERSLKQLQTLFEAIRYPNGNLFHQNARQRIRYFYSVLSSPFWKIEKHYADLLYSLGVYKSALDVYLRLEQWQEVIKCYNKIGFPNKAEEIIREKLAKNDNQPDMHCLLGEITGDIDCFKYSWKISNHRYAPAPKMLGLHYFKIKDYDQALKYFWDSVNVNSIQVDVWYRIGYIGLLQQDWSLAVTAYRTVLQFESDSFEAWNNLSKAYIKLGDKERAKKTLQEAIKCNFEEWKIWENYIAVCADLGGVQEIIQAWHRLIDIKGKYLDDQVADILVKCVQQQLNNQLLISKSLELFARITSTSPGTSKTWHLYARLLILANRDQGDFVKIEQCLQKSQRQLLGSCWNKDVDRIIEVFEHFENLSLDIFELIQKQPQNLKSILNSFKLSVNLILSQVAKSKPDLVIVESDKMDKLESKIEALQQIQNKIDRLKQ